MPLVIINSGDTAWMLLCGILVLLMTIPGLVLFYGGMVRGKNMLSIMMQSFLLCAIVSLVWMPNAVPFAVPQSVFVFFQMTFAIITPAVIIGAFAGRMKFKALLLLMSAWTLLVYAPVAHWVWSPAGWLYRLGIADYAGGTVVEINAGIAGLMCALYLGPRRFYGRIAMPAAMPAYAIIGASLLWVGWLGFNSGAAGGANANAGMAVLVTQIAAAGGTLTWLALEYVFSRRPSYLGGISGAVVGLVAITPAAGFVLPASALLIGVLAGVCGYAAVVIIKPRLAYDDSLDVFGVHGIGGMVGILATGLLAYAPLSGGTIQPGLRQFAVQATGMAAVTVYTGAMTLVLLKLTDLAVGVRISPAEEDIGQDHDIAAVA
jgi:Amt family ammonium transporter